MSTNVPSSGHSERSLTRVVAPGASGAEGYITVTGVGQTKLASPRIARGPPASSVVALVGRIMEYLLLHGPSTTNDLVYHISDMPRELLQGAIDVLAVFGIVYQLKQSNNGTWFETGTGQGTCGASTTGTLGAAATTPSGGGGSSKHPNVSCNNYHYALAGFARSPSVPDFNVIEKEIIATKKRTQTVRKRTRALAAVLADEGTDPEVRKRQAIAILNPPSGGDDVAPPFVLDLVNSIPP